MDAVTTSYEIVALLLKHGAKTNIKTPNCNETALMFAAIHGNPKIIKALLEKRAEKNLKDCNEKMAIDYAKENNNTKSQKLLN